MLREAARAVRPALIPLAARSLRRQAARAATVDGAIDLVFGFDFGGIRIAPMQARAEIRELLELLKAEPPRVVLEIGTAHGGTLFLWSRVASPDAFLASVDLPHGRFGGGYPVWKAPLYRSFGGAGQHIELVRADSHAEQTRDRVRTLLRGRPVDFLFIDGDHSYDGVARDFDLYVPLVRPGGIVALHDVVPQPAAAAMGSGACGGEVPRFWSELRARRPVRELVEDWSQGRFGIGVLRV